MNSLGPTRQGRCPFEWWKARPRSLDPNSPFYVLICSWMMKCIWPSVALYSVNCVTSANLATRQRGENFSGSCWKKGNISYFCWSWKMQIFDQMWQQGAGMLHWEVDFKQKSATATSSGLSITGWPTKFFRSARTSWITFVSLFSFQKKSRSPVQAI